MKTKTSLITLLSSVTILLANVAVAQQKSNFPGKPANTGRQEMNNSYHSGGQFSNGYRPLSTWSYQNSARSHAQALGIQGQNVKKIDPQTAKEHVAEVKRNVEASRKELTKIDMATAQKADILEHVSAMKKHYDAAEKCCSDAEHHIAGNAGSAELASCCKDMDKHLADAEAEHKKLMDLLNIELPRPATK